MERFVVREPRVVTDYQGNPITYPTNANNSRTMMPEVMYFGGYGAEFPVAQGFMGMTHVNTNSYAPNHPGPNQAMSGIDPRYLTAYGDDNAAFIAGQRQQMNRDLNTLPPNNGPFANEYESRGFVGPERRVKTFTPQIASSSHATQSPAAPNAMNSNITGSIYTSGHQVEQQRQANSAAQSPAAPNAINSKMTRSIYTSGNQVEQRQMNSVQAPAPTLPSPAPPKAPANEVDQQKVPAQSAVKTRADLLKNLYKSGPRAFSGPVEMVLKWHKALQDLGVFVFYEIVAKCVSISPGERCAKILVVRDDNGPAMQVVYYEIDFLLPELKPPPCTVRVVGRMMPGTSRLQAFSVRPAGGDDVTTLQRRAAVAAHHVAKLCKEFAPPQASNH